MTNSLVHRVVVAEPKAAIGAHRDASRGAAEITPPRGTQVEVLHTLFHRLSQSLNVLSGACELVSPGKSAAPSSQALRVWLQPHARQAEVAMHCLRDMRLTGSPVVTELSQSLTVLVLAADMLAQGQLSGDDARAFYDLLRRNAEVATRSLGELRAHFDPGMYSGN